MTRGGDGQYRIKDSGGHAMAVAMKHQVK